MKIVESKSAKTMFTRLLKSSDIDHFDAFPLWKASDLAFLT